MAKTFNLLILEKAFSSWPISVGPVILNCLQKHNLTIEVIPSKGNFNEYVNYVYHNKQELKAEFAYIKNHTEKGDSWGEILIVKDENNKIIASFGPNRIKKDKRGRKRALPGYFLVLKKFRNKKIGSALWVTGLKRMKKMGADYIKISVNKNNLPALKIYLNSGLKNATTWKPSSQVKIPSSLKSLKGRTLKYSHQGLTPTP
ncbi:GNAT family N-acetyltransferase [bacterium]|nr:GNAT family N-acetyltransferase [bacterium]